MGVFGVGGDFQAAFALGVFGGELPVDLRVGECACGFDVAVERGFKRGANDVAAVELGDVGGEIKCLLGGADVAAEFQAAFLQQVGLDVVNFDIAAVVDIENAVDEFDGDAVVVGGFGQLVAQVERTAQRGFGVVQIGRDAEREIQGGFGQVGHEGFGVDALPDDVHFAD